MRNYFSPKLYIYALFERVRIGNKRLFPLGVYQKIALIINKIVFRHEIFEAGLLYENHHKDQPSKLVSTVCSIRDGHASIHANALPHGTMTLNACKDLVEQFGRTEDIRLNPYSIAGTDELLQIQTVRKFLKSDALIGVACDYLGTYPTIVTANLLESRPREGRLRGSQNYHLDNVASRVVRLILHVSDVEEENGPFTYYPEAKSAQLAQKVGYHRRFEYGEIASEELERVDDTSSKPIQSIGECGSMLLVDTCRCLHYGSRVKSGYRHVLMATYAAPPYTNLRWMAGLD